MLLLLLNGISRCTARETAQKKTQTSKVLRQQESRHDVMRKTRGETEKKERKIGWLSLKLDLFCSWQRISCQSVYVPHTHTLDVYKNYSMRRVDVHGKSPENPFPEQDPPLFFKIDPLFK